MESDKMDSTRALLIPTDSLVSILRNTMPYDMFPLAHSLIWQARRNLPDDQHLTLGDVLDIIDVFTRGNFQRESIFDRLPGFLAGLKVAPFEDLHQDCRAAVVRG